MRIRQVDPRDIRWEQHDPRFRVHIWTRCAAGGDPATTGYQADEYEIDGADVDEVLRWAHARAAERDGTFGLFLLVTNDQEPGLVRLAGQDPTGP
jgi:hypothetical protein